MECIMSKKLVLIIKYNSTINVINSLLIKILYVPPSTHGFSLFILKLPMIIIR